MLHTFVRILVPIICCLNISVLFEVSKSSVISSKVFLPIDKQFLVLFGVKSQDVNITVQLNNSATKDLLEFSNFNARNFQDKRLELNCTSSEEGPWKNICYFAINDITRQDAGLYTIYKTGNIRHVINRTMLHVLYAPLVAIKASQNEENTFDCEVRAFPYAMVEWVSGGVPLEAPNVVQKSLAGTNGSDATVLSLKLNDTSTNSTDVQQSYMCLAKNELGSTNMTLNTTYFKSSAKLVEERIFNITGFIIGMIPPMFIAFYIIVHLSFKSRYAQERPEEDGMDPAIFGDPYHNLYH